eukprot:4229369-Amphidinium_carterae.1
MHHVVSPVQHRQQLWLAHPMRLGGNTCQEGILCQGFLVPEATTLISATAAHKPIPWHISQQRQHKSLRPAPSRQAGAKALGAVAAKGDEVAIAALVQAAGQDEDRDVRLQGGEQDDKGQKPALYRGNWGRRIRC